jgi:Domain of unknown function (DUF4270)
MRGKLIFFLILLMVGFNECSNSVSDIGNEFFNGSHFNLIYNDSVTVKCSTVQRDSLVTSNVTRLLVGYGVDGPLGTISSQSIFQLAVGSDVVLDPATTSYVGFSLHLQRDGYSGYDTTHDMTLSVYRLTKQLQLINGYLYNTSKYTIDKTAPPLGTLTFTPRPLKKDTLDIPLSEDLGRQFMKMAQNGDYRFSDTDDFQLFFNGLAIVPDTTTTRNFLGFTLHPELRIYYTDQSVTPVAQRHVSFIFGSNNIYFNKMHTWRANTPLSSLKVANDLISTTKTSNIGYLQCGGGLGMRLEMPYLANMIANDATFSCTRALLQMEPIQGTYNTVHLPVTLYMYFVDADNNVIVNAPQGVTLIPDTEYGMNTLYQADITSFVNSQAHNPVANNNALLLLYNDTQYRGSVDRVFLGDPQNYYRLKVKLYFVSLSSQQ